MALAASSASGATPVYVFHAGTDAQRLVEAVQSAAITREDIWHIVSTSGNPPYPIEPDPGLQSMLQQFAAKTGECKTVRGFCNALERDHPHLLRGVCEKLLDQQVASTVALEAQQAHRDQRQWARMRQARGDDADDGGRYH